VLVIVARLPQSPGALAEAASLTGLALADVRTRLAGTLPRVLLTERDPERAAELVAALETLGFATFACDPRTVPGDDDRLVARKLELAFGRLRVVDEQGEEEELLPASLFLIQKGLRASTKTEITKKSERRLDLGRALLSGGLLLTKKVETTSTTTTSSRDAFLLLHRRDGGRDVMLYERRIDYRFLGPGIQPTSAANFERLIARLGTWAPKVPFDERVSRPGFVSGLAASSAPPVDLALWLVQLVHLRG
jgi:hypothetical protein